MTPIKKCVLLAWSGGIDSTGLLCEYLNQGCQVDAFSVIAHNNLEKDKRELAARTKMRDGYFADKHVIFYPDVVIDAHQFHQFVLAQAPSWLFGLLLQVRDHHHEVAIAYVMNDDAVSFVDDFKAIWKSYEPLMQFPLPPLVFPYLKRKKRDILEALPYELQTSVTWCENPDDSRDRCGECVPCRKMIYLGLQLPPVETNAA
jgi:7-cyano-7-deazaguanine synthase in queuosine biosynthesis